MAAHKFWALLVTAKPGSGNGTGIAELQMRTSVGGAQAATGGTASGTSSFGHVAANAFDGSSSTIWHNAATGGVGVRLSYEFATPVSLVEMRVESPGSGTAFPGTTYGPSAMWVQWSDDGTTWVFGSGHQDGSVLASGDTLTFAVSDAAVTASAAMQSWAANGQRGYGGLNIDATDSGAYRVAGTVAIDGTPISPVARRVRLYHQMSGRLVRETWSAADGTFAFEGLALATYIVMAEDYTALYDPVARDRVVAVL
jgi:hypothetical protein